MGSVPSIHHCWPPGPTRCTALTRSISSSELNSAPWVAVDRLPANVAPGLPPEASSWRRGCWESRSAASSSIVMPAST